jgi:hypothetical protein
MPSWRSSVLHRDITEAERRSKFDLADEAIANFGKQKVVNKHMGMFKVGSFHREMFLRVRHRSEELTDLVERRREARVSKVAIDEEV